MKIMNKQDIKEKLIRLLIILVPSAVLIFLDQWTKNLAVQHLKQHSAFQIIDGVLCLQYLENRGAAFGIFQNKMWLFYILTLAFLFVLLYATTRIPRISKYNFIYLLLILLFSGAVGNFIDRVTNQYVIDFIYFSLINFPIFNVADIYVTVGAFFFLFLVLFYYKEEDLEELFPSRKKGEDTCK